MKKTLAISLSIIMLLNSAPVFALTPDPTAGKPGNAGGVPVTVMPTGIASNSGVSGTSAQGTPSIAAARARVSTEDILRHASESGNQLIKQMNEIVTNYHVSQKKIEEETNPILKNLGKIELGLALIQSTAASVTGAAQGKVATKVTLISSLITIVQGAREVVRSFYNGTPDKEKAKVLSDSLGKVIAAVENDPQFIGSAVPREVVDIMNQALSLKGDIERLNSALKEGDKPDFIRISAAAITLGLMIWGRKAPEL
jgi:hypothetical protein